MFNIVLHFSYLLSLVCRITILVQLSHVKLLFSQAMYAEGPHDFYSTVKLVRHKGSC